MKNRLFLLLLLLPMSNYAQSWVDVGSPGCSPGPANNTSMAIDPGGTPYVLYLDTMNRANVMKYDGSNWVTVGSPGFSGPGIEYPSIAIDKSGTPYVAFQDNAVYSGATVMKFDGSNWVYVGAHGFSGDFVRYISIAIDGWGTPYVVYQDPLWNQATVMKFDGSKWDTVGLPGFSNDDAAENTSIAIDESGTPYVIFQDSYDLISQWVTVMKFDGSEWVYVGDAGFSRSFARYLSITIKGNTPYVVYQDLGDLGKATVRVYGVAGWVVLGSIGFTTGVAYYTTIAVAPDGTSYIAYVDVTNTKGTGSAMVMKYDGGKWVTVGSPDFSAGFATYTSLAIDSSGTPYVAYTDNANSNKATVVKLGTGVGIKTLSIADDINIFPNPAANSVTIKASSTITSIVITNLIGQNVYSNYDHNREVLVDVSNLQAGMYLVRINGTEVRKFMKE